MSNFRTSGIYPARFLPQSLWAKLGVIFLLFVVAGSLALLLSCRLIYQTDSNERFIATTADNARFIDANHLPPSARLAQNLGLVLGASVYFMSADGNIVPEPSGSLAHELRRVTTANRPAEPIKLNNGCEAAARPLNEHDTLILVRQQPSFFNLVMRPSTLAVLAAFWISTILLAWVIGRGVMTPLRRLAQVLPRIEQSDFPGLLPGVHRLDEIGQVSRALVAARERWLAEARRREEAERLALLGRMATGIAHEIRNPLSAVRMHAQLIQSADPADVLKSVGNSVPFILDETAKIEDLVNQWMFLARPDPPQKSRIRLRELLGKTVSRLDHMAALAQVAIIDNVPDDLWVQVDARRMQQVFSNIVINAIQAMPRGGRLDINATAGTHSVRVTFRDTGPGFSSEALRRYADLFYSEKEGGMGIGLSICHEIIATHGGNLAVTNHPDGGAMVTVDLMHGERT